MVERPKKILIITNDKVSTPRASIEKIFSEPGVHIDQFENGNAAFEDLSIADCLDLVVYHLPAADPEKEISKAIRFLEDFNRLFPNTPFPDIIFTSTKIGVAEEARNRTYSFMDEIPVDLRNIGGVVAIHENDAFYVTDLLAPGKVINRNFLFPQQLYEFLRVNYNYQFPDLEEKFSILSPFAQIEIARQIKLVEDDITKSDADTIPHSKRPEPGKSKPANEEPKGAN